MRNTIFCYHTDLKELLSTTSSTVMKKSLRLLCKSDDFQHLACDCISHILLLHHKFVFIVVFHFAPILTSVQFPG